MEVGMGRLGIVLRFWMRRRGKRVGMGCGVDLGCGGV